MTKTYHIMFYITLHKGVLLLHLSFSEVVYLQLWILSDVCSSHIQFSVGQGKHNSLKYAALEFSSLFVLLLFYILCYFCITDSQIILI